MSEIIAITNQKGGVGKTTTTVNLGIALARKGKRILLVDGDPQGDLTTSLGYDGDSISATLSNLMQSVIEDTPGNPQDIVLHHAEGIDLIPSNLELSGMDMKLVTVFNRENTLKNCLAEIKDNYDYVLIDCMPSLGMITVNSLVAADSVIIPMQAQYLSAKGMTQLVTTISRIKRQMNPNLEIKGILPTLVDNRTRISKQTIAAIRENYGEHVRVFKTAIPLAVCLADASVEGKSIFSYEKATPAAREAYKMFAKEVSRIGRERYKPATTPCR